MAFCAKCGQQVADGAQFCGYCGASQIPASQIPASQAPVYQNPAPQAPVYQNPAPQAPVYQNAGYQNAGYQNAGYQNAGYQNPAPQAAPVPQGPSFFDKVKKFFVDLLDTPDHTESYNDADIKNQNTKLMSILAYLSWLLLIPLFACKQSAFARFHTNQGLVLAIIATAYNVTVGLLCALIDLLVPVLAVILGVIFGLAGCVFTALAVLGIINVVRGKAKELPFIGKYQILN